MQCQYLASSTSCASHYLHLCESAAWPWGGVRRGGSGTPPRAGLAHLHVSSRTGVSEYRGLRCTIYMPSTNPTADVERLSRRIGPPCDPSQSRQPPPPSRGSASPSSCQATHRADRREASRRHRRPPLRQQRATMAGSLPGSGAPLRRHRTQHATTPASRSPSRSTRAGCASARPASARGTRAGKRPCGAAATRATPRAPARENEVASSASRCAGAQWRGAAP